MKKTKMIEPTLIEPTMLKPTILESTVLVRKWDIRKWDIRKKERNHLGRFVKGHSVHCKLKRNIKGQFCNGEIK
jgi:hypothetical protein